MLMMFSFQLQYLCFADRQNKGGVICYVGRVATYNTWFYSILESGLFPSGCEPIGAIFGGNRKGAARVILSLSAQSVSLYFSLP